jgi:hypothetical protein
MNKIQFHSHEQQDEFIFNLFGQKRNGVFLDIACGNPIIGSNTYTLEKLFGWSGFGFDIGDCEGAHQWSEHRKAKFVRSDATAPELTEFLKANIPVDMVVDYISLDVDAANTNLAFKALERVIASGIRFKAMTFEHEYYIHGEDIRTPARELLESQGYIRLFEDVRHWAGGISDDSTSYFEDWWIDPQYFDATVINAGGSGLYYFECVEQLKEAMGNEYEAQHRCCRAFPDEYDLYWHDAERAQIADLFSRITPRKKNLDITVYDCFTFYNEFDLLELRLEELWDVVDYFVIAEANTTHQSKPKPFLLKERWGEFSKYHSKMRHIMVDDMPCDPDTWVNEKFQRKALERGLYDIRPDDIIITGDGDEIVRPEIIEMIKEDTYSNNYNRYIPFLPIFYFKLNYLMVNPCGIHGKSVVTRGHAFINPQAEREITFPWVPKPANADFVYLNHGGWHFSYFGKTDFAVNKIQSFAHTESNIPSVTENIDVDKMIKQGVGIYWDKGDERFASVKVDDYFPRTVVNNPERWADMIAPNAEYTALDFYPNVELTPETLDQHVNQTNGTFKENFKRLWK